jgi:hypothetical protein
LFKDLFSGSPAMERITAVLRQLIILGESMALIIESLHCNNIAPMRLGSSFPVQPNLYLIESAPSDSVASQHCHFSKR